MVSDVHYTVHNILRTPHPAPLPRQSDNIVLLCTARIHTVFWVHEQDWTTLHSAPTVTVRDDGSRALAGRCTLAVSIGTRLRATRCSYGGIGGAAIAFGVGGTTLFPNILDAKNGALAKS